MPPTSPLPAPPLAEFLSRGLPFESHAIINREEEEEEEELLSFVSFTSKERRKKLIIKAKRIMEEGMIRSRRRRWEDMETDCLIHIFRRLSMEDLSLGVPLVCKGWLKASLDPLCWSVLDFQDLDLLPRGGLATKFAARYAVRRFSFSGLLRLAVGRSGGAARELRFPLLPRASLRDLLFASQKCPRLKTMVIPELLRADEAFLPALVGKWKELERLEIEAKPSSFTEMVAQINLNCRKFSRLQVFGSIKQEDVKAIIRHLPRIKDLNLSRSYLQKAELVELIKGCRELETLRVNNCIGFQGNDEEVLRRVRASAIKRFESEGCKLLDESAYDMDECDPLNVLVI